MGAALVALQRARGWQQQQVAAAIGVKTPTISFYERGLYRPRPAMLRRLAAPFGVDEAELERLAGYAAGSGAISSGPSLPTRFSSGATE